MKYPQFTIAGLIFVILVIAVALGALLAASPPWAGAMWSLTFFTLICSLLGIALGRGERRAYWLGFALLGWSYLLLISVPLLDEHVGTFLLAPNLFPALEEVLHAEPNPPGGGMQSLPPYAISLAATAGAFGGGGNPADRSDFERIGIALEALLWAFLGGWAARYFASGRDEPSRMPHTVGAESSGG